MWTLENDDNGGKKTKTWVVETDGVRTLWASLHFKRDQTTFWGNTFLVDLLLHMAIWVSFWIPPGAAPARVSLVIITFLSFRILMSSLYAQIPTVTYSVWCVQSYLYFELPALLIYDVSFPLDISG